MGIICEDDIVSGLSVERILHDKRVKALKHLDETGSLPSWWELGIRVQLKQACTKFNSPEEYFEHGRSFFETWAESGLEGFPTMEGLVLWMGFSSRQSLEAHARRNPEYRDAHATLMTMLRMPLEHALSLSGTNTTGLLFRLKNVPDGWLPTDDRNASPRYSWKDRRATELTGAEGGPLLVQENKANPEETYLRMLEAGARLETEAETEEGEEVG